MKHQPTKSSASLAVKAPDDLLPGICRLIVNDVPCQEKVSSRGCCLRHISMLRARSKTKPEFLLDFALPARMPDYKLKEHPEAHVCRLIVGGVDCLAPSKVRGICTKHAVNLQGNHPDLYEALALPLRQRVLLQIKAEPHEEGVCRLESQEGPCARQDYNRGICKIHYNYLRRYNPNLLEEIA